MASNITSKRWICPSCNTPHLLYREESIAFGCSKCGKAAVYDEKTEQLKHWGNSTRFKRVSDKYLKYLKPGDNLLYNNEDYTVTGCMTFHVKWREYDHEDSAWESGTSNGVEWYAEGSNGNTLRIERDDGHFFIREIVEESKLKKSIKANLAQSNYVQQVEYGSFDLTGFTGEDDEALQAKTLHYRTIKDDTGYIYAEFEKDRFAETVIYNRLKSLSYVRLRRMKVPSKESIYEAKEKVERLSFFRMVSLVGLILLPFLLYFQNMELKPLQYTSKKAVFVNYSSPKDSTYLSPKFLGKVALEKGSIYCMEVYCTIKATNNDRNFNIDVIEAASGRLVTSISSSFYRETGRDSDGPWTEDKLTGELKFRVDQDGQYVFFARQSGADGNLASATLQFRINSFVPYRFYLITFLGLIITVLVLQFRYEQAILDGNLDGATPLMKLKG